MDICVEYYLGGRLKFHTLCYDTYPMGNCIGRYVGYTKAPYTMYRYLPDGFCAVDVTRGKPKMRHTLYSDTCAMCLCNDVTRGCDIIYFLR